MITEIARKPLKNLDIAALLLDLDCPMRTKWIVRIAVCSFCLHVLGTASFAQNAERTVSVLISTPKPYDRVVSGIQAVGGKVKNQYTYVDGLSADIPAASMAAVRSLVGANAVQKDNDVPHPIGTNTVSGRNAHGQQIGVVHTTHYKSAKGISTDAMPSYAVAHAGSYVLNMDSMDLNQLHAQGYTGKGVVVAVIDSGIRPGFPALDLDNSVIGCVDLVVPNDGLGCSNSGNDGHGTFVATLISGKAELDLTGNQPLLAAIASYAPGALFNGNSIALIGSAPASKIYAVRVFGADPNVGASESTIIAAIDVVIDKRKAFDQGKSGGVNIQVCNMSLGNSTLEAGRDLLDKSTDALLAAGIIPVISAGNAGPATLTIASPGSSFSATTVGAASFARNERIENDILYGPGQGALERPFSGTQTAYFSSRGPDADGRLDPDVVASGFDSFSQGLGATTDISIDSGTSYAAPIISGVAAILRQAFPHVDATEIRNAIIAAGDNSIITDGSTRLDQGQGIVNAEQAYDLLSKGNVSDNLPSNSTPNSDVSINVEKGTNLNVQDGTVKQTLKNLKPGQRTDILYNVPDGTTQILVTIKNVNPTLPANKQNSFYGVDDLLVFVHSAKTSAINGIGDYVASDYIAVGETFEIDDPEPGILRVSVTGDWTNAGTISTDVVVTSTQEPMPKISAQGSIADSQTITIPFTMPSGVTEADFELAWADDWGNYPTNDVDMILVPPSGPSDTDGATLNSPERATVNSPMHGAWSIKIIGFDLPAGTDHYKLTVLLDGKLLKLN